MPCQRRPDALSIAGTLLDSLPVDDPLPDSLGSHPLPAHPYPARVSVEGYCLNTEGVEGRVCNWDQDCDEGETCVGADRTVTMTVREKVEELTEQPGTSCAGCCKMGPVEASGG